MVEDCAELMAVALAEEAQRDNQKTLQNLDLMTQAEAFKSVTVAMAGQRQLSRALRVPLLDEREAPIRLLKSGRGRFRLAISRALALDLRRGTF